MAAYRFAFEQLRGPPAEPLPVLEALGLVPVVPRPGGPVPDFKAEADNMPAAISRLALFVREAIADGRFFDGVWRVTTAVGRPAAGQLMWPEWLRDPRLPPQRLEFADLPHVLHVRVVGGVFSITTNEHRIDEDPTMPTTTRPTTKSGGSANGKRSRGDVTEGATTETRLPPDRLQPHPHNPRRAFDADKLQKLADSFTTHGMLTPILARRIDGQERLQILGGERRWRAAQLAQLSHVPVRIQQVDDATALELLVVDNDDREDLRPLEKARGVELLTAPVEDGGAGLTLADAAARLHYSASWAKNVVRLLRLPPEWQALVDSGELPERDARQLVPLADVPELLAELMRHRKRKPWMWERGGESIKRAIADVIDEHSRPMDPKVPYKPENVLVHGVAAERWQVPKCRAKFKPNDEQRERLNVVTIGGVPRALNVKLFDELNRPHVEKATLAQIKRDAKRFGGSYAARRVLKEERQRAKTPAEQRAADRAKANERKKHLREKVTRWWFKWMRHLIAERARPGDWQTVKVLAWIAAERPQLLRSVVGQAIAAGMEAGGGDKHGVNVAAFKLATKAQADHAAAAIAKGALDCWEGFRQGELLPVPDELVGHLVADYDIDYVPEWQAMQRAKTDTRAHDLLVELWKLHNKAELAEYAKDADGRSVRTKADYVAHLANRIGKPCAPMPKLLHELHAKYVPDVLVPIKRARRSTAKRAARKK